MKIVMDSHLAFLGVISILTHIPDTYDNTVVSVMGAGFIHDPIRQV